MILSQTKNIITSLLPYTRTLSNSTFSSVASESIKPTTKIFPDTQTLKMNLQNQTNYASKINEMEKVRAFLDRSFKTANYGIVTCLGSSIVTSIIGVVSYGLMYSHSMATGAALSLLGSGIFRGMSKREFPVEQNQEFNILRRLSFGFVTMGVGIVCFPYIHYLYVMKGYSLFLGLGTSFGLMRLFKTVFMNSRYQGNQDERKVMKLLGLATMTLIAMKTGYTVECGENLLFDISSSIVGMGLTFRYFLATMRSAVFQCLNNDVRHLSVALRITLGFFMGGIFISDLYSL